MRVTVAEWVLVVGTLAAACSTLSFVPQLVKVWRQGGRDLSWGMLVSFLAGLLLWLTYGLLTGTAAVIAANAVCALLVGAIAVLKLAHERRGAGGTAGRRLRIAIDMDEVMADALGEHLRRYNRAFGVEVTADDLHGRSLERAVPPDRVPAVAAMLDASFFDCLEVMPGCEAVVRELNDRHEIVIATAAMDVPCSFGAKYRWLRRHFPFIPPGNFVFCGDKAVVDADYLIDDSPRHFARFKGRPILFSAPHNAHETGYVRVRHWEDVGRFFRALERATPAAETGTAGLRDAPAGTGA
jgi:5'(3')-deoxyribonucleotidase/uncharacterized protein with PQ loop repeat